MDAADCFPVFPFGEIDAGPVDVFDGAAGLFECGGDEGEALAGLLGDVGLVCTYRAGSRDMNVVADAGGAGEADDGFVGADAGNVLAMRQISRMSHSGLDAAPSGSGDGSEA